MSKKMHVTLALVLSLAGTVCVEALDAEPKSAEVKAPEAKAPEVKAPVKVVQPPSPLVQLQRVHSHRASFNKRSSARLKKKVKLPVAADVLCGQFGRLLAKNTLACITRAKKGGPWDSIVIDLNRNRDLTDDKIYALPANKTTADFLIEHDGKQSSFTASAYQNSRGYVYFTLVPKTCISGTTAMGDKMLAWVACDCDLSGKLDAGDTAYLDTNANGKMTERGRDETFVGIGPDSIMYMNDSWYSSLADETGKNLSIVPYAGKLSKLTIDHSEIAAKVGATHHLGMSLAGKYLNISGVDPVKGVELPSQGIASISGVINAEKQKIHYTLRYLDLKNDLALKLKKPACKISVSQTNGSLRIGQKIGATDSRRVTYRMTRGNPGPLVEVFSENSPDVPITKGNMKYG